MLLARKSLYIALFVAGLFFLSIPNDTYAGIDPTAFGCCGLPGDSCIVCEVADCAIRGEDCAEMDGAFLFEGNVCDTNMISCTNNFEGNGCCVIQEGLCRENQTITSCDQSVGSAWYLGAECSEVPECEPIERNVPTLSVWGVIALAGVLGIAALIVIRRRSATT